MYIGDVPYVLSQHLLLINHFIFHNSRKFKLMKIICSYFLLRWKMPLKLCQGWALLVGKMKGGSVATIPGALKTSAVFCKWTDWLLTSPGYQRLSWWSLSQTHYSAFKHLRRSLQSKERAGTKPIGSAQRAGQWSGVHMLCSLSPPDFSIHVYFIFPPNQPVLTLRFVTSGCVNSHVQSPCRNI